MTYYVKKPGEDEPKGPFEVKEIVHHIENAWVPENALIAVPGSHEWIPIKQVPEFATAFAFLKKVGLAPPVVNVARPYIPPGQLSCPKCSNAAWGGRGCFDTGVCILLAPFLIGIIMWLLIKPQYKCRTCGYTFQP